jgi:hypothetical protein
MAAIYKNFIYLFLSSLKIMEFSLLKVYCKMYSLQDPNGGTVKKTPLYTSPLILSIYEQVKCTS